MIFKWLLTIALAYSAMSGIARANEGYFDSNGVKIRYVTEGEGEAVVLIHGWMADSSMWGRDASGNTKLNASGMAGFQLIALDCRGHGKSDKPHDPSKYGSEMAADVVRLLDHLKIKKAHLIGYSMGAMIAAKVAATHPERVLSVIYGGQAPLIIGTDSLGSQEVDVFAKAVDEGKGLEPYIIFVMPHDRPKPTMGQAAVMEKIMFDGKDVKALAAAGKSFKDLAVTPEDFKKCKAPALFIYGAKESGHLRERVSVARALIGHGDVKVIEGADHMTTLASPEFGAAIVAFLRANSNAGSSKNGVSA